MLRKQQVSYVGTSVTSAEEWHLRKKYEGIARDVFGGGVRIKNGQIVRFRDTAVRILTDAGWKPVGTAHMMQAARILREHAEELASLVEITARS
jgi:ribosomal protein L14